VVLIPLVLMVAYSLSRNSISLYMSNGSEAYRPNYFGPFLTWQNILTKQIVMFLIVNTTFVI